MTALAAARLTSRWYKKTDVSVKDDDFDVDSGGGGGGGGRIAVAYFKQARSR